MTNIEQQVHNIVMSFRDVFSAFYSFSANPPVTGVDASGSHLWKAADFLPAVRAAYRTGAADASEQSITPSGPGVAKLVDWWGQNGF